MKGEEGRGERRDRRGERREERGERTEGRRALKGGHSEPRI